MGQTRPPRELPKLSCSPQAGSPPHPSYEQLSKSQAGAFLHPNPQGSQEPTAAPRVPSPPENPSNKEEHLWALGSPSQGKQGKGPVHPAQPGHTHSEKLGFCA